MMARKRLFPFIFILIISSFLFGCQSNKDQNINDSDKTEAASETKDVNNENLKPEDKVVTVNGMTHSYSDLKFSELMSKVEIELNRKQDEQAFNGQELQDKLKYWDEQIKYHDNYNVNLSKMIELYSMYLLAQEKGLRVDKDELQKTIADFSKSVEQSEPAKKLIAESSIKDYENHLETYFTQRLLTDEIYGILKEDVKKENPHSPEQEIAYLTDKKYEELYQSQIESEDIQIQ